MLSRENLTGRKVAIQLYPDNPNAELLDLLRAAGASSDSVLCYVYGSEAVDRRVLHVIEEMAAGRVDLIASASYINSSYCRPGSQGEAAYIPRFQRASKKTIRT
jgi:ABC-type nitrate/sulfonate/bicarbonate transport system substrate-binding protein